MNAFNSALRTHSALTLRHYLWTARVTVVLLELLVYCLCIIVVFCIVITVITIPLKALEAAFKPPICLRG